MPEFTIHTKIVSVSGFQVWTVEAENESEAIAKFKNGEGEHERDEIEVTDIGDPRIIK